MADTIVYSSAETYLFVVPNILLAIINGGIQRYVSRQETVIMNGSMSHDPDFAATDDLRYNAMSQINIPLDKKINSCPPIQIRK